MREIDGDGIALDGQRRVRAVGPNGPPDGNGRLGQPARQPPYLAGGCAIAEP